MPDWTNQNTNKTQFDFDRVVPFYQKKKMSGLPLMILCNIPNQNNNKDIKNASQKRTTVSFNVDFVHLH